jgi:predicted ATP-grasp superfamily ATP-dependent carboligase
MTSILVTDGQSVAALAAARALARRGLQVTSAEDSYLCPTHFSRYVHRRMRYPTPEKEADAFVEQIGQLIREHRFDAVLPVRDATCLLLAEHKDELARHTAVLTADLETIMKGRDKRATIRAAMECDVPRPETLLVDGGLPPPDDLQYPLLIKPAASSGARGITLVSSPSELGLLYGRTEAQFGPCMLQELIPGNTMYCYSALYHDGECKQEFMQRQTRNFPVNGGTASYAESVYSEQLRQYSRRLLDHLKWDGIAHVEYKMDPRDGQLKLMEINPRLWMSIELAIAAGVDFPYSLFLLGTGEELPRQAPYKIGETYRWLLPGDMLWFFSCRDRWQHKRSYFRFFAKDLHYAVLSFTDPGPTLGACLQAGRFLLARDKRRFTFGRGWR